MLVFCLLSEMRTCSFVRFGRVASLYIWKFIAMKYKRHHIFDIRLTSWLWPVSDCQVRVLNVMILSRQGSYSMAWQMIYTSKSSMQLCIGLMPSPCTMVTGITLKNGQFYSRNPKRCPYITTILQEVTQNRCRIFCCFAVSIPTW